jgi:hypothetical protein
MTQTRDGFIIETFILSRSNNEQWLRFVEAFKVYSMELAVKAISAPRDEMQVACGRAQQAMAFLNDFDRIDEHYSKTDHKRKAGLRV